MRRKRIVRAKAGEQLRGRTDFARLDRMTDEEAEAAALSDPDNPPLTDEWLKKAKWVLDEMERRMSAFGGTWNQTTAVQLYTVQDVYPVLESELGRRGVFRNGLTWHFDRPPVVGLDYEMDCRCVHIEKVVA